MPRPNRGIYLTERQIKSGRVWVARWFEGGRKREQILGPGSRAQADQWIVALRKEREAAARGRHEPENYPIANALANYAREHAPNKAGAVTIGYNIAALEPFFGSLKAGQITPALCRQYAKERGVKPATIARELTTLAAALNHDRKEGRLTHVPAIPLPAQPPPKDRWLTPGEAALLVKAARHDPQARGHLPRFILIALYTAARTGAILDLRWNQVNLQTRRIDLNPPGRTQTEKGRPIIPIPRRLLTLLHYWRARSKPNGYVVNIAGQPIGSIKKSFKAAAARAGLKDVTPHTIRHTAATWMAQRGVDLFKIAGYLGQRVTTTTARYAHSSPDHLSEASDAMDRRIKP
jgi:integrase